LSSLHISFSYLTGTDDRWWRRWARAFTVASSTDEWRLCRSRTDDGDHVDGWHIRCELQRKLSKVFTKKLISSSANSNTANTVRPLPRKRLQCSHRNGCVTFRRRPRSMGKDLSIYLIYCWPAGFRAETKYIRTENTRPSGIQPAIGTAATTIALFYAPLSSTDILLTIGSVTCLVNVYRLLSGFCSSRDSVFLHPSHITKL
jgi:hypothetical protein